MDIMFLYIFVIFDSNENMHCAAIRRGRVSKQVTNGSKTAVSGVMGFICVLLGSSTVQLHDSHDSRRSCACSVVGMATVLEEYATEEQRSVVCVCVCVFFLDERTQFKGYS
jgi:hypothetical protein